MKTAKSLMILALVAMLVVVALVETTTGPTGLNGAKLFYVVGSALYFAQCVVNPRRGGLSLMVGFYFLFFVAVPAFVQVERNVFPFYAQYTRDQLSDGFFVLSVAQATLIVGHLIGDARAHGSAVAPSGQDLGRVDLSRLYRRFAVCLLGLSGLIAGYVGPEALLATRADGVVGDDGGVVAQALLIGRSTSLVALCLCVMVLRQGGARGQKELTALASLIFLILNYPPGLSRFQLLGATLAVTVIAAPFFRTSTKVVFALLAPLFLVLAFPAIKALGLGGKVASPGASSTDVGAYLLRVDFDSYKQIVDATVYLEGSPLRHGENFLGALLFWVPRTLWEGKPVDSGRLVSSDLGYEYTNVSSPLPAEALLSSGVFGVILVFSLLGYAMSRVEAAALSSRNGMSHKVLFYALSAGFITIILRGALNGIAPVIGPAFVACAMLAWRANRRVRNFDRSVTATRRGANQDLRAGQHVTAH